MGYRTLTFVYEHAQITEHKDAILCVYHQWGLPSSWGERLNKFLGGIKLVDGYMQGDEAGTHANGMGCLAAQLVAMEKTKIGNCYIQHAAQEIDTLMIEYIYEIWPNRLKIYSTHSDKVIYDGVWGAYKFKDESE